jgi:hypothetical protein
MGAMNESSSEHALDEAKRDRHVGWAFQAMEAAFRFLVDEFHYRIRDVHLHQEGSYLSFVGRNATLIVTHEEWWNGFSAVLSSSDGTYENLWDVLSSRDPQDVWPAPDRTKHISREDATSLLDHWAGGFRELAADLL